jgi:chromosome segregation protein
MRLKSIKLSGFKSFVDPTTIPIDASLIGIVGPNGCGKSNIIDAVRWVMGESSATRLRGDSMADVVFNGSNSRKPVGLASVELVFDNSDGSAGGQYAAYSEISIRREAGRDAQSDYFLNKTRCRRKDITDLFLGTGLGPRAYSIIEQGMVTRIIEAKPEDLRGYIEEAAGISKYKERRRETENRIKHTRENLDRVADIRRELESQLTRLEKQSKAAARYKELKAQERLKRAELAALRFRDLDTRVQEQDRLLAEHQNALEAVLAAQRGIEAEIEHLRAAQIEANDAYNGVHQEFYSVGAEISRLEQAIQHARETRATLAREQEQVNRSWEEGNAHLQTDLARLTELRGALDALAPRLAQHTESRTQAQAALTQAEAAMREWQTDWEALSARLAEQDKRREIQHARMRQLELPISDAEVRHARLREESQAIEAELAGDPAERLRREAVELDHVCEGLERALGELETGIRDTRASREQAVAALDGLRRQLSNIDARLASLRELQAAVERRNDPALGQWLNRHQLDQAARLASRLSVEPGWEKAVERALGMRLVAVCVNGIDALAADAEQLATPLALFDLSAPAGAGGAGAHPLLLAKIRTELDLAPLLGGVYAAETLAQALGWRASLAAHESIVTREGAWLGRNWLSHGNENEERAGWLERDREIHDLQAQSQQLQQDVAREQSALEAAQKRLHDMEGARETRTRELTDRHRARAQLREQLGHKEAHLAQLHARREQIAREQSELGVQLDRDKGAIEEAARLIEQAQSERHGFEEKRDQLAQRRELLQAGLDQARASEGAARDALHRLEVEREGLQTAFDSTRASHARLDGQLQQLNVRREELAALLAADNQPEAELNKNLDEFLRKRVEVETRLTEARQHVSDLDTQLREQEQARGRQDRAAGEVRQTLEGERVVRQELLVRRENFSEQVREAELDLSQLLAALPAEATESAWAEELERIGARIERLGPINLVAIEEYNEQSERKGYLDKQHEDLTQALETLEEAIRKMDRETKTLFKDTFDKVNEHFQVFFPQLFGGGSAYLDLTEHDLLDAGVTVMARPPGKRNSTIHLLSGGEKALTAVALIFSIFQLNPAPFCLLDEVDAPLDDANVERYSQTLRKLSERSQLIYVTHNKISMEMADLLVGVTMSEPGVSRLVAVDVEEALQMVAEA